MNNVRTYETIRIHRKAYDWLKLIALQYSLDGSPRSMTWLASQAILSIPEPQDIQSQGATSTKEKET